MMVMVSGVEGKQIPRGRESWFQRFCFYRKWGGGKVEGKRRCCESNMEGGDLKCNCPSCLLAKFIQIVKILICQYFSSCCLWHPFRVIFAARISGSCSQVSAIRTIRLNRFSYHTSNKEPSQSPKLLICNWIYTSPQVITFV